jgi:apolipoprotein N-acyltransferase
LPLQGFLEQIGLEQLAGNLGSFARGPGPRTLKIPGAPPVGPLICYEIIFPDAVTDPAHRPAWLVNLTDDSWFGSGAGPLQHFDAARVRAIEEGLPVVRAANKGVAAIIGPKGEIVASSPPRAIGALDGPLPEADAATPYARFGDLPMAVLLVGLLIFGLGPHWRRGR